MENLLSSLKNCQLLMILTLLIKNSENYKRILLRSKAFQFSTFLTMDILLNAMRKIYNPCIIY